MARNSYAQPDAEADWDFSERQWQLVDKVVREVSGPNRDIVDPDDLRNELYLWLAVRKKARDAWEAGHWKTLYMRIRSRARDYLKKQATHYERETPTDFEAEGWFE